MFGEYSIALIALHAKQQREKAKPRYAKEASEQKLAFFSLADAALSLP